MNWIKSLLSPILYICSILYLVIGIFYCIINDINCFDNSVLSLLFIPTLFMGFLGLLCAIICNIDIHNLKEK